MMNTARLLLPCLLALGLTAAPLRADVLPASISVSQSVIEMGQGFTFTVQGPAGANLYLLVDFTPGQVTHPAVGVIDIAFSPLAAVFPLGTLSPDGLFVRFD